MAKSCLFSTELNKKNSEFYLAFSPKTVDKPAGCFFDYFSLPAYACFLSGRTPEHYTLFY